MELTRELTISTLEGGAVIERLEEALKEILADCGDINKLPSSVREIDCKIKIKPDDDRVVLDIGVEVNTKLGKPYPIKSIAFFNDDTCRAAEATGKQQELPLEMPEKNSERMTVIGGNKA